MFIDGGQNRVVSCHSKFSIRLSEVSAKISQHLKLCIIGELNCEMLLQSQKKWLKDQGTCLLTRRFSHLSFTLQDSKFWWNQYTFSPVSKINSMWDLWILLIFSPALIWKVPILGVFLIKSEYSESQVHGTWRIPLKHPHHLSHSLVPTDRKQGTQYARWSHSTTGLQN